MTEFNERDGGETPRYGENGAEVAKVRGMILHLLRADSEAQAVRRLRRLCSAVMECDLIEPAFLSVQECRDLGILGSLEATYLLFALFAAVRGQYIRTDAGRVTAEGAFMSARGEDAAAGLLRSRPTEYDWRCSSGALLILDRRAVPEVWGDEEPDPRAVSAISLQLAAFAGSETRAERKTAVAAAQTAIRRHKSIDAVAAIQSMREVGMITFAQSLAFSFTALRSRMNQALAVDRESARWFLERREPAATASDRRADMLLAAIYRRVGEHRAANMLRDTPGEFHRMIASVWATPQTSQADADVRDVPVTGMLQSTAVRRAKDDILRVLHARSNAGARRYLSRLTERVGVDEAEAAAAVTAVQELRDIGLIHVAECHYLLDRLAIVRATGSDTREMPYPNERVCAADFLDTRGEQVIARMLREESEEHEHLCSTGCKTLMESRLAPDRHLRGASDPVAVARIFEKLAVWASRLTESENGDPTGPRWDDVVAVAEGETAASGVAAVRELVRTGSLTDWDGAYAVERLLALHVARGVRVDRVFSRVFESLGVVQAAGESADPARGIDVEATRERLFEESFARHERLTAAALRRFGEHIFADTWAAGVLKRGY